MKDLLKPELRIELQRTKINTLNNYISKFKNKIKRIFGYEIANYDHVNRVVDTSGGYIRHNEHDFIMENIDAVVV